MHPTPCQLKLLKLYRDYRSTPPCAGSCLRRNLAPLALLALIIGAGTWLALYSTGLWFGVGCFAIGLGIGSLSRIVRQLINAVRFWPLLAQIVDWSKVDALLADKSAS